MTAAGLTCVLLQEALDEIRHVLQNQAESLQAKFKDMDKDGNGCIDVHEWTAALQQLVETGVEAGPLLPAPWTQCET